MSCTRNFRQLGKGDAGIAGGKGASLGEMTQAGIPVPPGFVVLADAFEQFLDEANLAQELHGILDNVKHEDMASVEHASEKIHALITGAKMPEDIAREIAKQFRALDTEYVAVRSSATAEDSSSAAWAGQLDTFLNTTEDALLENVQRCWASLFTPRAIFYRFEKGMHGDHISVAVVVQKMVQSEVSGIAFSVHPVTEDHNQLIIEAGFGLGEAIVSGQVTPDSYVMEKITRHIIDKNITYQSRALWRASPPAGGGGNEWRQLSEEEGTKPALTDAQVLELAELIIKIENHYGFPCDIEWAFEAGQFFITQSRPITTLSSAVEAVASVTNPIKWEKVLQRNFPPLAWTTGAYYEFHGLAIGPMTWIREREMQVKYNTVQSYMIQDPNALYKTNINELIHEKNTQLEKALDERNQAVITIAEVMPGKTLEDLHTLQEQHKLAYGLMIVGFDVAIDIRNKIDEVIQTRSGELEAYLATPWKPTAIQRERAALVHAQEDIARNSIQKQDVLKKMVSDFGYLHQDYLGKPWTIGDYDKALEEDMPHSGMSNTFDVLGLSDYEQYLVSLFRKTIFLYEEGRNAMVRAVWAMKETVATLGLDPEALLYMTDSEVEQFAVGKARMISDELVARRKQAFALHFDNAVYTEYSGPEEVKKLIDAQHIGHLWEDSAESANVLKGSIAYKGFAKGKVRLVFTQEDANQVEAGEIIITPMTQVEFLSGIRKCAAIVTDEGGIICHAAIVSREFGKPCILGTQKATKVFKNGDLVEVDADNGVVRIMERTTGKPEAGPRVLSKFFERERPLSYMMLWYSSDHDGITHFTKQTVPALWLLVPPEGRAASVWNDPVEVTRLEEEALPIINGDARLRKEMIDHAKHQWNKVAPYLKGERELTSVSEFMTFYEDLSSFWWSMGTIYWRLLDHSDLDEKFKAEIFRIRDETQYYSGRAATFMKETIEKLLPTYTRFVHFISPDEVERLAAGGDALLVRELEERVREGAFIVEGKVYPMSALAQELSRRGFSFEATDMAPTAELSGTVGYKGKVRGKVRIITGRKDVATVQDGEILVAVFTDPDYLPAMKKAAAFVTDEGGMMSHAAIISRELKKPCIIGTKIATQVLKDGDFVEVDADNGVVRIVERIQ